MDKSEYHRELRRKCLDSGMCTYCRKRPADDSRTRCTACKKTHQEAAFERRRIGRLRAMRLLCGGPPRCQCPGCGVNDVRFLSFDHVRNDGWRDRQHSRASVNARDVVSAPDRFQVLCYNCNFAKGHRAGDYRVKGTQGRDPGALCPLHGRPHNGGTP